MGTITILPETTKNPITLMGQRAGVCLGGNVEDPEKNYKRGMDCIISGHGRVMEYVNVEMIIAGYSASRARVVYTYWRLTDTFTVKYTLYQLCRTRI